MAQDKRTTTGIKAQRSSVSDPAPRVSVVYEGSRIDHRGRGLGGLSDEEAEAMARELEDAARDLRRGWRGGPRVLH